MGDVHGTSVHSPTGCGVANVGPIVVAVTSPPRFHGWHGGGCYEADASLLRGPWFCNRALGFSSPLGCRNGFCDALSSLGLALELSGCVPLRAASQLHPVVRAGSPKVLIPQFARVLPDLPDLSL